MKIQISSGPEPRQITDEEIEDALETLVEAEEIRADEELMRKVKLKARSQKSVISSIADLKNAYDQAVGLRKEEQIKRRQEEVDFEKQVQAE